MIGKRIIATKTDIGWGFVKGDELEITDYNGGDIIVARNITQPQIRYRSFIRKDEYRIKVDVENVYTVKFIGIPILKITKEKR